MDATLVGRNASRKLLEEWEKYDWDIVNQLPHFSGIASVIGSSIIIITIFTSCRRLRNPYHRLMLGLSLYDLCMSSFMFMGQWAHPKSSCWDPTDAACIKKGTIASCDAFGFFYQLGAITIPLYNVALSTYIAVSTGGASSRRPITEKFFDVPFHVAIFLFGFIQAVIPLFLLDYNTYSWLCMVAPHNWNENKQDYERGNLTTMLIYAYLNLIVVVLSSCYVTVAMLYTFFSVYFTTRQNSQNRSAGLKVACMGMLYTIPFYITWIIPSIFFFIFLDDWYHQVDGLTHFTRYFGLVWIATFLPLQGFFNLFVYFVPICLQVVGTEKQEHTREARESCFDDPDTQVSDTAIPDAPAADESTRFGNIYDQMI